MCIIISKYKYLQFYNIVDGDFHERKGNFYFQAFRMKLSM